MRKRVGILISGRGTDALSLIRAAQAADYPAEIAVVISNRPDAPGLQRATEAGVFALTIDHRLYGKDREAHERAIDLALREAGVEFVALAGYMRILTPFLVEAWAGRMINVHPALLPSFTGLDTHRRALEAGVKLHGCSVHWVSNGVDEGPLIGQAAVPVLPDDDEARLAARVLAAEHRLYPLCLAAAVSGIAIAPSPLAVLANPPFA
ncbi:MAG TPA: phosphoribosylglycinamide formyltransferase [Caulobacteraceae bacterium]|jgi:formyltetrahydrofolate-dependent phosphoribosylglycinamide formyltransferase